MKYLNLSISSGESHNPGNPKNKLIIPTISGTVPHPLKHFQILRSTICSIVLFTWHMLWRRESTTHGVPGSTLNALPKIALSAVVCTTMSTTYFYRALANLRTFGPEFSNNFFFSENFTIGRWWVSVVRNVKKLGGHRLRFGKYMPRRTPKSE